MMRATVISPATSGGVGPSGDIHLPNSTVSAQHGLPAYMRSPLSLAGSRSPSSAAAAVAGVGSRGQSISSQGSDLGRDAGSGRGRGSSPRGRRNNMPFAGRSRSPASSGASTGGYGRAGGRAGVEEGPARRRQSQVESTAARLLLGDDDAAGSVDAGADGLRRRSIMSPLGGVLKSASKVFFSSTPEEV